MDQPVRVWVKPEISIIQVAWGGMVHQGRYDENGHVYDLIKGKLYLLQACLELWNPPIDKFEISYQELQESEWLS